jgi:3-hydroxyacyl-CoA dehydrogenase
MFWGEQVGLAKVLEKMRAYQGQMGDLYKPAPLLETLAAAGKGFAGA